VGEILSQSEIDALLEAISSGSIKIEDLAGQEKKRRLSPSISIVPTASTKSSCGRWLCSMRTWPFPDNLFLDLAAQHGPGAGCLHRPVDLRRVRQNHYTQPTVLSSRPTMSPLAGGKWPWKFPPSVAFAMVDLGCWAGLRMPGQQRELTEIEQTVIKQLIVKTLPNLKETWQPVTDLNPAFETIELDPLQSQSFTQDELWSRLPWRLK